MGSKGHEVSQSRATISQIDYIDSLRYETGETGPSVADLDVQSASVETPATETPARCTATTRRGTQCSRKARHDEHCTQHAVMAETSAQDSETITLEDLAAEYSYTVEGLAAILGDTSLTAHDGVDADAARRLISTHMLVPGQIWESKHYDTDHTVTEHVGDDLWAITGPTGNVYVTTPQTFRTLNRLTDRTQVR